MQERVATLTVGSSTLEAHSRQIIIIAADRAEKFVHLNDEELKQIDMRFNGQLVMHWLED